jgi:hypothetical protein
VGRVKTIDLDDREFLSSGESRITPLAYSKEYSAFEPDTRRFRKTAACDEAIKYASTIEPQTGKRFILVSAVGDFYSWGDNKKGDAFPEHGLLGRSPVDVDMSHFNKFASKLPEEYGYACFPTKLDDFGYQIGGGNTFHEHHNRFASSLLGKPVFDKTGSKVITPGHDTRCGFILASFWNPKMKRVELIQEVWEDKLPHVIRAIDEGYMPGISMACDIPFDRCSVCGNLAPNENGYCEHLQRHRGMRGHIMRDGTPIVMINDFPVFFDSSIVKSPAAAEGRALLKVASTTVMPAKEAHFKEESLDAGPVKSKDILHTKLQAMRMDETTFSEKTASELRDIPYDRLTAYLGVLGVYPTCADTELLMFGTKSAGLVAEHNLLPVLTRKQSLNVSFPTLQPKMKMACGDDFSIDEFQKVVEVVQDYLPLKGYYEDHLLMRPKKASHNVDLDVLITKILTDRNLRSRIQKLLVEPTVQWELEKMGINGIYNNSNPKLFPVYDEMANAYMDTMERGTGKFYR